MTFFFDENLPPSLVAGLRGFGEDVQHLTEVLPRGTPDLQWLAWVGERKFVAITCDVRIRRRPLEASALKKHGVGVFFLGGKNRSYWSVVEQVVINWQEMKRLAAQRHPPFAYLIPPKGRNFRQIDL